ncbi:hypothetical protein TRFO_18661 [Tritrichomonas foetus]|uniref:Uncharacterized protein n=1 Tax=Tritrichomonas foetus TaxID=1144522 RepID=A0A1J4KQN8_9EUKA|nr:hypothetical protein TRFO_18661 [Tritrichomonas foetus]|eukprot:OHT11773.1 hypothetical protein TRFO_18661 [Tritrichomonas foetus]
MENEENDIPINLNRRISKSQSDLTFRPKIHKKQKLTRSNSFDLSSPTKSEKKSFLDYQKEDIATFFTQHILFFHLVQEVFLYQRPFTFAVIVIFVNVILYSFWKLPLYGFLFCFYIIQYYYRLSIPRLAPILYETLFPPLENYNEEEEEEEETKNENSESQMDHKNSAKQQTETNAESQKNAESPKNEKSQNEKSAKNEKSQESETTKISDKKPKSNRTRSIDEVSEFLGNIHQIVVPYIKGFIVLSNDDSYFGLFIMMNIYFFLFIFTSTFQLFGLLCLAINFLMIAPAVYFNDNLRYLCQMFYNRWIKNKNSQNTGNFAWR